MIKFSRLRHDEQDLEAIVIVAEDVDAGILLRWVPNTGLWHRATELENDYLFGDNGGIYEPISIDEAHVLLPAVTAFDEKREVAQRLLSKYDKQIPSERRTNTEMGFMNSFT